MGIGVGLIFVSEFAAFWSKYLSDIAFYLASFISSVIKPSLQSSGPYSNFKSLVLPPGRELGWDSSLYHPDNFALKNCKTNIDRKSGDTPT